MFELGFYVCLITLAVLVPTLLTARFLEWREQDADRRIDRLEYRRIGSLYPDRETDGC